MTLSVVMIKRIDAVKMIKLFTAPEKALKNMVDSKMYLCPANRLYDKVMYKTFGIMVK